MSNDTFDRARLATLSRIIQSATGTSYGGDRPVSHVGFVSELKPVHGDLVRIESCSPSKWYLSWFVEMLNSEWNECLLESIEDREQCKWGNIGISVFSREELVRFPEWRWSDEQWLLWDRWKNPDPDDEPYIVRPCRPVFDGDGVLLSTRIMVNNGEPPTPARFDDWRSITDAQLTEAYRAAVKEDEERMRTKKPVDAGDRS